MRPRFIQLGGGAHDIQVSTDVKYLGTNTRGLMKSTDRGFNWSNTASTQITDVVAIDPFAHNTVYGLGFISVMKSTDGARSGGLCSTFPMLQRSPSTLPTRAPCAPSSITTAYTQAPTMEKLGPRQTRACPQWRFALWPSIPMKESSMRVPKGSVST